MLGGLPEHVAPVTATQQQEVHTVPSSACGIPPQKWRGYSIEKLLRVPLFLWSSEIVDGSLKWPPCS